MTQNNSYDSAFFYGEKACMQAVHNGVNWPDIEQVPNQIGEHNLIHLTGSTVFTPITE